MSGPPISRLRGKVAVVTGGTDGIGLAISRRLGREGATVVLCSRKEANVARAVGELRADGSAVVGVVCHVGAAADRERLLAAAVGVNGGASRARTCFFV